MRGLFALVFALFKWFMVSPLRFCPDSELVWEDNLDAAQTKTGREQSPVSMLHNLFIYHPWCWSSHSLNISLHYFHFRRRSISPGSGWRALSIAATLTLATARAPGLWTRTRTLVTGLARSVGPGWGTRPPSPPSSRGTRWCSRSRSRPETRTAWCPWPGSAAHGWSR